MARARNIKPGFYKNEDLAECSVWARLLFPGLWMLADREGRIEDRPKRIKGEIFPFDAVEVEPLLAELTQWGFIQRYVADGKRCILIKNFVAHQCPHSTEKDSDLPDENSVYTVNERTKNGCITGKQTFQKGKNSGLTVSQQLDNSAVTVDPPNHNALNPESLITDSLNPESIKDTQLPAQPPSRAGAVCVVVKSLGIGSVSPQHPKLLELLADGADVAEFESAARKAVDAGKGFAYALGIVKNAREDSKRIAASPNQGGQGNPSRESFRERDDRLARERMQEICPSIAAKAPRDRNVIDITPTNRTTLIGVTA